MCKKFMLFLLFCSLQSYAAGNWLRESPAFGALDLMPGFAVKLVQQDMAIKLSYATYEMDIHYQLVAQGDEKLQGRLHFPLLCMQTQEEASQACVETFSVEINGDELPADALQQRDLQDITYLLTDYPHLLQAFAQASAHYAPGGAEHRLHADRIGLRLYSFDSGEPADRLAVRIRYHAPYYAYISGNNSTPFRYYSDDVLFFGFSPLARWNDGRLERFSVTLDSAGSYGAIEFGDGMELKAREGVYIYEDDELKPAKLKPLTVTINRRAEKQYKHFQANQAQVEQELELQAEPAEDLQVLRDHDFATAWCVSGRTAELRVSLHKPATDTICEFDGLAIISGQASSAEALEKNSRLRSAELHIQGVERFSQEAVPLNLVWKSMLTDSQHKGVWNPYATARYFSRRNQNENFLEQTAEAVIVEGGDANVDLNQPIELQLKVLDIYKGATENVCITEVLPLYHCY